MADLPDLSAKAIETIRDVQDYLQIRVAGITDPEERQSLEKWHSTLQETANRIAASKEVIVRIGSQWDHKKLSQKLDLTHQRIRELHERSQHADVDAALRNFNDRVQMLAGPNGPGAGRPRTRPR